jgi:hypothetical protein
MNLKKVFKMKYPGFSQQSRNMCTRTCSCTAMRVFKHKGNIFNTFEAICLKAYFVSLYVFTMACSWKYSQSCQEYDCMLGSPETK